MINQDEFKKIYHTYYEAIYRFILIHVLSEEIAKDLSQEVFLRAWKKHSKLDLNKSIKSYLFRTANNLLIDYYRKKDIEKKYLSELNHRLNDIESIITSDIETDLIIAIEELPKHLKSVFIACRIEGFSSKEAAKILKLSPNTIACHLSKAMKFMREKIFK